MEQSWTPAKEEVSEGFSRSGYYQDEGAPSILPPGPTVCRPCSLSAPASPCSPEGRAVRSALPGQASRDSGSSVTQGRQLEPIQVTKEM